jgi:hypothetical protein
LKVSSSYRSAASVLWSSRTAAVQAAILRHSRIESEAAAHRSALIDGAIIGTMALTDRATTCSMLPELLAAMTRQAQARGQTDRQWAAAAGLRHETLCRVKRRGSCDASTLEALARGCGLEIVLRAPDSTPRGTYMAADPLFPLYVSRDLEERLLMLCAREDVDPARWRALGPGFFVAGVANLVASANGLDPDGHYATLAETLHPGVRSLEAFRLWLARSPVKASRFLPMLRELRRQRLPATA